MQPMNERETISAPVTMYERDARDEVVALRAQGNGELFELSGTGRRFRIGADPICEIVVEDLYVSAVHCVLERRGGSRLVALDRDSKNGMFVDGARVDAAELRIGSVLRLGKTTLVAVGAAQVRIRARERLVGVCPAFQRTMDVALRAAVSDCSVLIVGETGTGKELFARLVHEASKRHDAPFVAVNCGAIPSQLIESELFGHVKGSFTGAVSDRDGVFVQADRGTLFLDELGELPRVQQPALLRVLESRRVKRIGDRVEREVDVRIVAATNRLELGGDSSPLREDLYHRIATVIVEIPPLRRRVEDLPLLIDHFSRELVPDFGPRHISPETLDTLSEYFWPGNVRELRHAVQRATALSQDELSVDDMLPPERMRRRTEPIDPVPVPVARESGEPISLFETVTRNLIVDAYERYGSIRRAAKAVGMPRSTFADRLRRYKKIS